jgi:hypothetical protein
LEKGRSDCKGLNPLWLPPDTADTTVEISSGSIRVSAGEDAFTLAHANNAQNDGTFGYVRLGEIRLPLSCPRKRPSS